ncbi:MAG TPA: anhydro-N-acetylmuramic acid kinase [Gammaproteobacteria bacterium]
MSAKNLFIGLMSGTSLDGVDAVAVDIGASSCNTLGTHYTPYPPELRNALLTLIDHHMRTNLIDLGELDTRLGHLYAETVLELLRKSALKSVSVTAIGCHGQTVLHRPPGASPHNLPFTIQIGDPNIIAYKTGITTIADFRRRDIAAGGQGAPLVPAFHAAFFQSSVENRIVLNIGGIANITVLSADGTVRGFDTGPGNTLLDQWTRRYLEIDFDTGGKTAAQGRPVATLLKQLAQDAYFALPPPKSTGREYFNLAWLEPYLANYSQYSPVDVLATLTELTAASIVRAVHEHAPNTQRLYICGGGIHNSTLISRLEQMLPEIKLVSTATTGLDPDYVEATAFAWLAKRTLEGLAGNLPSVTGAQKSVVLGGIYRAV